MINIIRNSIQVDLFGQQRRDHSITSASPLLWLSLCDTATSLQTTRPLDHGAPVSFGVETRLRTSHPHQNSLYTRILTS